MGIYHNIGKCFLIFINFMFTALGLFLIGFGAYLDYKYEHSESTISLAPELSFIPKTIVIIGIVVSVVYFIGFLGACTEKAWMLKLYATILLIALIFKIGVALFTLADGSHHHEEESRPLPYENMFKMHNSNEGNKFLVDAIQLKFQCCGYLDPEVMKMENGSYVSTCCGSMEGECAKPLFPQGCYYKIEAVFNSMASIIKTTYYAMFGVKALCIAVAFGLASSIAKKSVSKPLYKNFA